MVRLRCDKCSNDAAVVSLLGYTETYLCEICERKALKPSSKNTVPYRQLASLVKTDAQSDPLVCSMCKISPARVFSSNDAKVYCWRCNEHAEKEGNNSPRYLVFGIRLKGGEVSEQECYLDEASRESSYWKMESDSDSILIDSPHGAIPTVSLDSNLISHGSIKSLATSKSNETNETLGLIQPEYQSDTDAVERNVPDGVVEGFPCGTIPVSELPGFKRHSRGNISTKKRRCIKSAETSVSNPSQRRCMHCGVLKTPQWRAGPSGQKTLCNACGVKYKAGRLSDRAARGAASGRGRNRGRTRKSIAI